MRPSLSQRGNALLLVLSLSAFVGLIAMEMYRRSEVTGQRSQQALFKDETRVVMEAIASNLQNPETCTRMLFNAQVTPATASNIDGTPVTLNYVYDTQMNPPATNLTTGAVVTPGMVLARLDIFVPALPDRATRLAEIPGIQRRYRASLRAAFRSQTNGKLATVNYMRDTILGTDLGLPFYVWVDENRQIKSCFGINSAGAVCNLQRGYYYEQDPAAGYRNHEWACRQTGFMTDDIDSSGNPVNLRGSCRFAGIQSPGGCPVSSFPSVSPIEIKFQDGSAGNKPRVFCMQCN